MFVCTSLINPMDDPSAPPLIKIDKQTVFGGTACVSNLFGRHRVNKPTVVVLCQQTRRSGTVPANPLWWYSICKPTVGYSISKLTLVALYQQTHSGGTLFAIPRQWCSISKPTPVLQTHSCCILYQQTHSGSAQSANPLRWYSICKPTPVVLCLQTHSCRWYPISKPTPMVLYLQTHHNGIYPQTHRGGTLSTNPLQWYSI